MKKATGSIDKQVGSRVRMRRMLIGMSQEKLGDVLGLTFQQVQKYEKGTNRIGVGRLLEIARILGVAIDFFFDGVDEHQGRRRASRRSRHPPYVADFISTPEGLKLIADLHAASGTPKVRRRIVELVALPRPAPGRGGAFGITNAFA